MEETYFKGDSKTHLAGKCVSQISNVKIEDTGVTKQLLILLWRVSTRNL